MSGTTAPSPELFLGSERLVYEAWPSIGAYPSGRWVGRLWEISTRLGPLRLGPLVAVVGLPVALVLYFRRILPWSCRWYRVTTRGVRVLRGIAGRVERSLDFDDFDEVLVDTLPGQEGLRCGDVVFRRAGSEVLRLPGVWLPLGFLENCRCTRQARLTITAALRPTRSEGEGAAEQTAG